MWKFDSTSNTDVNYLDNYTQAFLGGTKTTVYVGNNFERNVTTGEAISCYTFNGQRVAMRSNAGVMWLHGDMLGSASPLTNANGSGVSQAHYKSWVRCAPS